MFYSHINRHKVLKQNLSIRKKNEAFTAKSAVILYCKLTAKSFYYI